jgi:hypothetical protein
LPDKWHGKTPRLRIGTLPIPNLTRLIRLPFAHPHRLGRHHYRSLFGLGEATGILYTEHGGFIDLAHVRNSADWAAAVAARVEAAIENGERTVQFRTLGPSVYIIHLDIQSDMTPENIRDLSIRTGQYASFIACLWHETITWYGYKIVPVISERPSAFSYEELYSDALGVQLAGLALRDDGRDFNAAMTAYLQSEILRLKAVPKRQARRIGKQVDGRWWSSRTVWPLNRKVRKRNVDAGEDDGMITPWLASGNQPRPVSVPSAPAGIRLEIMPNLKRTWPAHAFAAGKKPDRIDMEKDLAKLLETIRKDIRAELGPTALEP